MRVTHGFGPFYTSDSEILILGSFPSVQSRRDEFYYAHPQNRFWRVLSNVYGCDVPVTTEDKKSLLSSCRLALWDVIDECDVEGSSDASIRNVVPTDIMRLLPKTQVRRVVINGRTAERYFNRFYPDFSLSAVTMPSTSPANASWTLQRLTDAWAAALLGE